MTTELSLVQIGITTKNRWIDLADTLTKIAEFGLGHLRIIIIDDGSDQPCPFDVTASCPQTELIRFSESKGLIVRRNQLAQELDSKYYLSLDDDSFPASGSLEAAITFAESCNNLFCLSFPIFNPLRNEYQSGSLHDHPYRVRAFIGCGHLLNRSRLLELGGYREELVHFLEESEISARAFHQGLYCYHFPGFQIHHVASTGGRNWARMDFYGARNTVLWNDWFVPPELRLVKQSRTFISRIIQCGKTRRLGQLKGELAGIQAIPKYRAHRQSMSSQAYQEWRSLPSS